MSTRQLLPRLVDDDGGAVTGFDAASGVPAAWYPDPQGPPLLRWWDGDAWTGRTMERPAAPSLAGAPPGAGADRYVPMSDFASAFPSVPAAGYASVPDSPASTHTAFAWGLALYPVVQVVIIVVITFVVKSFGGDVPSIGVLGSSVAVSLYCGYNDAKVLKDRGFRPPGWGWALIPLVYFIIRAVRVGRGSLGPLLAWVAIQAVFTVIIVMSVLMPLYLSVRGDQPLTTTERAALLTPAGMAEAVAADLRANDHDVTSIVCPQLETTLAGAQVTCQAETPTSTLYVIVETTPSDAHRAYALGEGWIVEK